MSTELQDLEVRAGNTEIINCVSDTSADSAIVKLYDINWCLLFDVPSTLQPDGLNLQFTLSPEMTMKALSKGTMLEIAWNFGNDHIENTRLNLVGLR